jgi:CheY-like chemotaxis protein
MLGGKIRVQDNPGKDAKGNGSIFYFVIPYKQVKKKKVSLQVPFTGMTEEKRGKILNVLIAEDDVASEMLFSKIIESFSKEIYRVRTGVEAVEVCRNNPEIDLILMDIKMPVIDGYEATQLIRQFNKKVVIIAQTAYALKGDREKALKAGCDDYISKPIKKDELLFLIGKHLSSREN